MSRITLGHGAFLLGWPYYCGERYSDTSPACYRAKGHEGRHANIGFGGQVRAVWGEDVQRRQAEGRLMSRPTGTPGTLHLASDYPARIDHDGQLWVKLGDGEVEFEDGWQSLFTPDDVPEWVTRCEHEPVCDTERECDRQAIADDRQARAEADR